MTFKVVMSEVCANSRPAADMASRTSRTVRGDSSQSTLRISSSSAVGCLDCLRATMLLFL